MFGWFSRKKKGEHMDKNANTASPSGLSQAILAKVKIQRRFEIFVEEFDEEGGPGHTPIWKPVKVDPTLGGTGGNPIITVNCQADLQEKMNFYKQIGQRFRVVREIDPPSSDMIRKAAIEQGLIKDDQQKQPEQQESASEQTKPGQTLEQKQDRSQGSKPVQMQAKPKIVTIGDMQIKYDGDKVYQKQWVRLTPAEAGNFRVVSDSSNKISPMAGKHLEAKRWVLIENATEEDDQTEGMINA